MIQSYRMINIKSFTKIVAVIIFPLLLSSCASTKYWGNYIQRDMHEYVTDENGIPLSLDEMRTAPI